MQIKIKPFDTLYFRTGRPFTMGSETWADFMFPPLPSTFYGAIRSFLIFQRGGLKEFEEKGYKDIGTVDKKGTLKISGPFLYKSGPLFPAPMDLVELRKGNDKELVSLTLINESQAFISDYPLEKCLIYKPKRKVEEPNVWFMLERLKDYLKNKNDPENKKFKFNFNDPENKEYLPYLIEPKIGIARESKTLTSKDGHLYRIPMIRLNKNASFVLDIDGLSEPLPDKGTFQLGGEGRAVKYEILRKDILNDLKNIEFKFENNLFKIYLATPAIFNKGWISDWIDESNYTGEYNGMKLRLIACSVGKPIFIGGWDIANKRAKPMQKAVPAGSVYYFEILDKSGPEKIRETFHLKNISDINSEEGFGLSIVGEVKL